MEFQLPSLEDAKQGTVLLVDKPYTWTSFDVINKIRKQIHTKIGHAGTLDPLATGLLICCTGKMTKSITEFQKQDKEYTGIIQLGAITPTFDLESEPEQFKETSHIDKSTIDEVKQAFIGEIAQLPPIHSAIKKDGKPLYKMARAGIEVKVEPRQVSIHEFDTCLEEEGALHFRIKCSTGTYIRSIANDIGASLGVGGYLKSLRRTKIGNFDIEKAHSVADYVSHFTALNELVK